MLTLSGSALSSQTATETGSEPDAQVEVADNFKLIGHSPLLNRGMNSAPAIYGNRAARAVRGSRDAELGRVELPGAHGPLLLPLADDERLRGNVP